jgi:hypothetical protein
MTGQMAAPSFDRRPLQGRLLAVQMMAVGSRWCQTTRAIDRTREGKPWKRPRRVPRGVRGLGIRMILASRETSEPEPRNAGQNAVCPSVWSLPPSHQVQGC